MRSLLLDCTTIYECGFSFTVISGSNKIYTSINTYNIRKNHWLRILQSYILKLAKPLATTEAMRNKAVLLFVYWNFWINSRKRTKKPPVEEPQTVRNQILFRKSSRTLFHFSGYS